MHYVCKNIQILIVVAALFPNRSTAQNFDQDEERFFAKGYKFRFQSDMSTETRTLIDPVTGKEVKKVIYGSTDRPVSVNGRMIYNSSEVTTPPKEPDNITSLETYVLTNLCNDTKLRSLPDGDMRLYLKDIIVDENGKIVYYNCSYMHYRPDKDSGGIRSLDISFINPLLSDYPDMKPATLNGNNVIARFNTAFPSYIIELRDHVITYRKDNLLSGKGKF